MNHSKISRPSLGLGAVVLALAATVCASASASTLFADNFQGNLSQWGTNYTGAIVADPLVPGGKALGFGGGGSGGDIFTAVSYLSATAGQFILSYDYLGLGNGGGYVGFNNANGETWLSGDGSYATPFRNRDTGAWEHMSFAFTSLSAITLKLEEWNGQNSTPYQALFKNLVLTDANGPTTAVPEPSAAALVGLALAGLAFVRRRAARGA